MSSPAVAASMGLTYIGGNANASRDRTLICLRCTGLAVSPRASFGVSMLSNLYVRATNSSVKNEKRVLKLFQSEPFDPTGRPPTQYNYTHVYTSEVFEDTPDCCASLLASIHPHSRDGKSDSKMRLSVFYSSNLTGNKDVLLASATFTERELQRGMHIAGELVTEFMSEYLAAPAKCCVEIVPRMAEALDDVCVITAGECERNPLTQDYVFYSENDPLYPIIDAREETWEPAYTTTIPMLFLDNVQASLRRSITAWEHRQELERLRQSRFKSIIEAHSRGWHALEVEVKGARFLSRPALAARASLPREASLSSLTATPPPAAAPPLFLLSFPLSSEHCENYAGMHSSGTLSPAQQINTQGGGQNAVLTQGQMLARKAMAGSVSASMGMNSSAVVRKIDERAPSTFVEICVEDSTHTFTMPVGRTATEYCTAFPMYGSSVNSLATKKMSAPASAANDTVQVVHCDKEFLFTTYEHTNRHHVPRRWRPSPHNSPSQCNSSNAVRDVSVVEEEEGEAQAALAMPGTASVFHKYVPRCEGTCVSFEVVGETTAGQHKILGKCSLPLSEGLRTQRWLPVSITAPDECAAYGCVELLVSVSVLSAPHNVCSSPAQRAPDRMPTVLLSHRDVHGTRVSHTQMPHNTLAQYTNSTLNTNPPNNTHNTQRETERASRSLPDSRTVVSDCYEWLWQLGFNGTDPLQEPTTASEREKEKESERESEQNGSESESETEREAEKERDARFNERASMFEIDKAEKDAILLTNSASTDSLSELSHTLSLPLSLSLTQAVTQTHTHIHTHTEDECASRVDCEYSLAFLSQQLSQLRSLSAEVAHWQSALEKRPLDTQHTKDPLDTSSTKDPLDTSSTKDPLDSQRTKDPLETQRTKDPFDPQRYFLRRGFRSSPQKKDVGVQPLSVNLHLQLLTVRPHCEPVAAVGAAALLGPQKQKQRERPRSQKSTDAQSPSHEVLHSVTCGSLCAHYLGYKSGGLFHQEDLLVQAKNRLNMKKRTFRRLVTSATQLGRHLKPTHSAAGELLAEIYRKVAHFEALCVEVGRRRVLCISQALSVAVNAFALKLNMLCAGQVAHQLAQRWLAEGLLIVFEGLLSVVGNERAMLEDTISAVDALRFFQVHLRESENERESDPLRFSMCGREIVVSLSRPVVERLPDVFRERIASDSAIVKLFPVLFTQGIDIQQTMVTTFGGDASRGVTSTDLQHSVNMQGLALINAYSHKYQPVSVANKEASKSSTSSTTDTSPPQSIHPFVCALHESIIHASVSEKNVDLLLEAERVALYLGGVRVTFCKSGKDRTGMAVTLEQSRQLGERFGCGISLERCVRDTQRMRLHGTRLAVCEKNIGRAVYSINALQAKFLPLLFRPPPAVCEDILKKDNS